MSVLYLEWILPVCLSYIFSTAAALTKVFFFPFEKNVLLTVFIMCCWLWGTHSLTLFFFFFFNVQAVVDPNYNGSLSCTLWKKFLCACLYFRLQALVISSASSGPKCRFVRLWAVCRRASCRAQVLRQVTVDLAEKAPGEPPDIEVTDNHELLWRGTE